MIAIYARQSLDKKDSISIETQIELCKKEIGDEPYKEYVDRGYSGKNTNRPQFKAMMQDVENGVISKIIVYKLDRLSRSTLDFGELMDALSKHNVEFSSTREKFDTSTPIGKAMLNIIMVFAQLERETIQVRVQDNFRMRSSRGAYDAKAPYGYAKTKVMVQGKAVSTLKPDKAYSLMVKKIFEQYAYTSTSLGYLARTLNQQGIKSANGAAWDSCKLSKLLCNPIYVKADAEVYKYYRAKGMEITNDIDDFRGQYGCVTYGQWDRAKNKFAQLSGLTLSITLEMGAWTPRVKEDFDFDMAITNGFHGPDPHNLYSRVATDASNKILGPYSNEELDNTLKEAVKVSDQTKRGELYKYAQKLMHDDYCIVPFAQLPVEDYAEVHVIDLRFFRDDIAEYAKANGITDTLVLYGVQSF